MFGSTWICISFPFGRFHSFTVLGKREERVGHVQGPSGNRIMVVPAPYEVYVQDSNTCPMRLTSEFRALAAVVTSCVPAFLCSNSLHYCASFSFLFISIVVCSFPC